MPEVSIQFRGQSETGEEFMDGPFYLTQTQGWTQIINAVNEQPADSFFSLRRLIEEGEISDTTMLTEDLMLLSGLVDESLHGLIDELVELVGVGAEDETIEIIGDE